VRLREWTVEDAAWYAEATKDAEVQRYTADPPTLTAALHVIVPRTTGTSQ